MLRSMLPGLPAGQWCLACPGLQRSAVFILPMRGMLCTAGVHVDSGISAGGAAHAKGAQHPRCAAGGGREAAAKSTQSSASAMQAAARQCLVLSNCRRQPMPAGTVLSSTPACLPAVCLPDACPCAVVGPGGVLDASRPARRPPAARPPAPPRAVCAVSPDHRAVQPHAAHAAGGGAGSAGAARPGGAWAECWC